MNQKAGADGERVTGEKASGVRIGNGVENTFDVVTQRFVSLAGIVKKSTLRSRVEIAT